MSERVDSQTGEVDLVDASLEEFGQKMGGRQDLATLQGGMIITKVGDLFGSVTTAQAVIAKRDIPALMQTLRALAETFGDDYIYSWDVKDKNSKREDGKTTIEGATINLANDLAREFGNNVLDIREIEGPNHWVFYGRFTDLQTGSTLTRAFRQRKNALAGGYENDRKLDMAYQMGQSKCLRNVVVNALRSYSEFMFKVAKTALIKKIEAAPAEYLDRVKNGLKKYQVTTQAAEAMVGRTMSEWDPRDIAKVFSALKAVSENLVSAAEAFPSGAPVVQTEQEEETETGSGSKSPAAESDGGDNGPSSEAESAGEPQSREAPKQPADKADKTPKATPGPSPTPTPTPGPTKPKTKPAKLF